MTTFFTIAGMVIVTLIAARFAIGFAFGLWVGALFGGKPPGALALATVAAWIVLAGLVYLDWGVISEHVTISVK
jgi:hypothetical protein